ncbi:MAG TPA: biotin-dependent carboxyltransferase family protein [Dokdonella sp.]|nr:biotin-dependent carboxyltransferase family protein [Dokdonella sp.]
MSMRVESAGLLTSIQDSGRTGFRHLGVGVAGALDSHSLVIANLLVGNAADAAVLEITLAGPTLVFECAACIAICGAEIDAGIGAQRIPGWRRIDIPAGSRIKFGACRRGARAYLAVAGGFAVARVLGSASTDLRAGFGGHAGRALKAGDRIGIRGGFAPRATQVEIDRRWIDPAPDLDFAQPCRVRLLPGHDALADADALFANPWRVEAASNRQGLRLHGNRLALADARERVSEPVMPGTLQLPPAGSPILLLQDAQTHGGYPRIGHAIAADLPRLAQLRPGESVHFLPCTPAIAKQLLDAQRQRLARMAIAIARPDRSNDACRP